MGKFRLHDWNDVRLLIACAERGSFAAAAAELGVDQSTVSKRISNIENAVGRPLFTRRRSGASPTPLGDLILQQARAMADAARAFEDVVAGGAPLVEPVVRIAASDGLLTYTLIPVLLGNVDAKLPLDRSLIRNELPRLAFSTSYADVDIAVLATNPGELPNVRGSVRVRKVGRMHFRPVAGNNFPAEHIDNFDQLTSLPLLDIGIYKAVKGLDPWNELVENKPDGADLTVATTPELHKPLLAGEGVTVLPPYAPLFEQGLKLLQMRTPTLAVDLWLVAHEDNLREPAVRNMFDLLGTLFTQSVWFRPELQDDILL